MGIEFVLATFVVFQLIFLFTVIRLVSTRKQSTSEESSPLLETRNLVEAGLDLVVTIDADGKIIDASQATEKLIGVPRRRLIGSSFLDYVTQPEKARKGLKFIFSQGFVKDYPVAVRSAEGRLCKLMCSAVAIKNEDGKVERIYAAARDITEIKKTEKELRLFMEAVEEAPDGVQIADLDGYIVYANKAVRKIFGFTPEEYRGKHLNEINVDPEFASRVIIPSVKENGSWVGELMVKHKKSYSFPGWLTASLVRDGKGEPIALVCIIKDITAQRHAAELSNTLNHINEAIHSTLDFDQIMQTVVSEAGKALGSAAGILMLEDNYWVVKHVHGLPDDLVGMVFTAEEARGAELAAKTKKPVVSNDALNDERLDPEVMREYKIQSLLVAPLIAKKRVIGALYFSHHSAPIPFRDPEVDFASKLAAAVSLAIENSRLYDTEHKIANTLQEALLKMPETIKGIEFSHLYRSATEAAKVGGDFYDIFELENNRVGIIIGDVSGKGVGAASFTSLVKNCVKAYSHHDDSPASAIAKTNEIIGKTSFYSMFVTIFFGILDVGSGQLTYCNAGHPPPVIKRKSGKTIILEHGWPAIGALTGLKFSDSGTLLEKGDILFAYTDGITEARLTDQFFGEGRLIDLVKDAEPKAIKQLSQIVFQEVINFTGGVLTDDLALLAISPTEKVIEPLHDQLSYHLH